MVRRLLAAGRAMWIVTGLADQLAFAPGETPGLAQPVYRTHRFEFVVVSRAGRMIEGNDEILERLPGLNEKGPRLNRCTVAGMRPLVVSRWHCIQTSIWSFELRRAGFTMLPRMSSRVGSGSPGPFGRVCFRVRDTAGNRSLRAGRRGIPDRYPGASCPAGIRGYPLWQNMHL